MTDARDEMLPATDESQRTAYDTIGKTGGGRTEGGAAFPRPSFGPNEPADGMSLRDWFAGQTLVGLGAELVRMASDDGVSPIEAATQMAASSAGLAAVAYTLADAMLNERQKP